MSLSKLCSLEQSRLKVKSADSDIILGKTKSTWLHFDDSLSFVITGVGKWMAGVKCCDDLA